MGGMGVTHFLRDWGGEKLSPRAAKWPNVLCTASGSQKYKSHPTTFYWTKEVSRLTSQWMGNAPLCLEDRQPEYLVRAITDGHISLSKY